MSGTAYGPWSCTWRPKWLAAGGWRWCGTDPITLDVRTRGLRLHVDDTELAARRAAWAPAPPAATRGHVTMYIDHVRQADRGADLDFRVGKSGAPVARDDH